MSEAQVRYHDSLRDVLDFVQTFEYSKANGMKRASCAKRTSGFNATESFDEAVKLARHGWHEHTDNVDTLRRATLDTASVASIIEDNVRVSVPDVVGGSVDMGRYLSGDPKAMRNRRRQTSQRTRRVVNLVVVSSVDCGTNVKTIVKQGSQLVALVDVLTVCGFAVNVQVEWGVTRGGDESIAEVVTVKPANEPLDLSNLMFSIAHPDAFRRIGFALFETQPDNVRTKFGIVNGGGYSMPKRQTSVPEDERDLVVVIGSAFEKTDTEADWIRNQVDRVVRSAGGEVVREEVEA